jgi:acetyl esterase/lipase
MLITVTPNQHGGAWGSGQPWLYRLIAAPFLEKNLVVAIVGYRTYPGGDIIAQVHDLDQATQVLTQHYPQFCKAPTELGVCVMGHSSGAHISFLMMTEWTRKRMQRLEEMVMEGSKITASMLETVSSSTPSTGMRIDSFVGISGPYNISHHFDYEASRGLEEISPMKPALRFSRSEFRKHSPALQIVDCLSEWSTECEARALDNILPRIALLHGMEDEAVPFTSTAEAASLLRACGFTKLDEVYFARCAHNECALQIMTGGPVRDTVLALLETMSAKKKSKGEATKTVVLTSRL